VVEIGRYTRFFDSIWDARVLATENLANPEQKVRLSQVIAVDCAVDRRQNAAQNVVHERLARIEGSLKADVA
jgi:hypothetical protein